MQRWSVPDKMQGIITRIRSASRIAFSTLFNETAVKGEIIVTFVALLELLRLRHVTVVQTETFGEIELEAIPDDVPDSHLPIPAFEELQY